MKRFDLGGFSMVAYWLRGLLLAIAALTLGGTAMAASPENTLYMDVPFGRVVIAMRPDLAPDPRMPEDSRLWAALQNASGGTWGGCVFDPDAILRALNAGAK